MHGCPAAGSSVIARCYDVLTVSGPELVGHTPAVAFDVGIGRLDVVPEGPLPADVDHLTAAALPISGLTASRPGD